MVQASHYYICKDSQAKEVPEGQHPSSPEQEAKDEE